MAPQFTATKGPSLRWLQACTARATNSLPVPDSPRTSTGAMPRATLAMRDLTMRIGSESPTMRSRAATPVEATMFIPGGLPLSTAGRTTLWATAWS